MGFRPTAFLALLLLPVSLFAQTLAERVPADAALYVGWKGSDSLGAPYDQSHLKAILDGTNLSILGSDAFGRSVGNLVARQNQRLGRQLPALLSAGKDVLHYPTALYLSQGAQGMPALALIVDAGANAGAMGTKLKTGPAAQTPLQIDVYGNLLVLSFGTDDHFRALVGGPAQAAPAPALAADATFQAAMKQVDAKGVCVAYCNTQSLIAMAQAASDPASQAQQKRLLASLGLDKLNQVAISGDFAGKDWGTRLFLAAPAPRKGLLKLVDGGPLSMDLLKLIPPSATFVSVGQLDLAALMDETRGSIKTFDPALVTQYDRTLAQMNKTAGADLRADLASSLGKEWAVYCDPATTGSNFAGWVFINRPQDAAKTQVTLSKIEKTLVAMANVQMRQSQMILPLYEKQYGQTTVHCLATPGISPAWAVRDGVFYLGFYPQSVVAAADFATSGKPGFVAGVAAIQAKLGSAPASFSYLDLPRTAPGSYGTVLLMSRYSGFADLFGVQTPMMLVPPLPTLMANLSPASSCSWADAAGWHMQSTSPFPGSELLAGNFEANPAVMQMPVMMSILLPSLGKARETANRAKCSNNMRQIGLGITMYSNDNKGKYPDDLGTMAIAEGLSPEVFTCPSSSGPAVPLPRGATPEQTAEWVNENSQFVYIGAGLTNAAPAEQPVLYEPIEHHGGDGANVMFADAHVEFVTPAALKQLLADAKK